MMRSNMQHVSPYRYSTLTIILLVATLVILWGDAAMATRLPTNGHIPSKYTSEGEDISPPLAWEGVSNGVFDRTNVDCVVPNNQCSP